MKLRYRISPEGAGGDPSDAELLRYRDSGKLLHNYQRARDLARRPVYKDPKVFIVLVVIALVAWLVSEATSKRARPTPSATEQRP